MNRKMTLFALPLNCWGLGESGLGDGADAPAASALPAKNPARSSNPESATPVNPAPACQRNSRRVRPQKVFKGLFNWVLIASTFPATVPAAGCQSAPPGTTCQDLS